MLRDGRLIKLFWPCFQQINIGKRCVLTVRVPNFDPTPSTTGIPDVLVIACYGPVSIDGLDIERGRGKSSSNTVWHSRCKEFWGIIGIRIVLREGIQWYPLEWLCQVWSHKFGVWPVLTCSAHFPTWDSKKDQTLSLPETWWPCGLFLGFMDALVLEPASGSESNMRNMTKQRTIVLTNWPQLSSQIRCKVECIHYGNIRKHVHPFQLALRNGYSPLIQESCKASNRHWHTFTLGYESKPSDLGYLVS